MKKMLLYIIFTFTFILSSGENNYFERDNQVIADSIFIHTLIDSVGSDIVKDEIKALLDKISSSRKIFHSYSVDVYKRQKFKYLLSHQTELTISDLLDSLSDVTGKAKILRVNKIDLDNGNGKKLLLSDNSFKDLDKEPDYKKKEVLLDLIEKTALKQDQKSSLEWIWGKSPDSDAYFSTKLTFFDDKFSLYPEYRFFVGNDPLRDKKSWFFTLEDYPVYNPDITGQIVQNENNKSTEFRTDTITAAQKLFVQTTNDESAVSTDDQTGNVEELMPFDCGSGSDEIPDFTMDIVFYKRNSIGELDSDNKTISTNELLKDMFKNGESIKYIRLVGSDFLFEGNEVKKSNSESVIEISGDINVCNNRLKKYLAEGMIEPNKKRSIEMITGINKDKLSYNAMILTVYDGQTSLFEDYKVYASSEVRKDKNSWFNKF